MDRPRDGRFALQNFRKATRFPSQVSRTSSCSNSQLITTNRAWRHATPHTNERAAPSRALHGNTRARRPVADEEFPRRTDREGAMRTANRHPIPHAEMGLTPGCLLRCTRGREQQSDYDSLSLRVFLASGWWRDNKTAAVLVRYRDDWNKLGHHVEQTQGRVAVWLIADRAC